MVRVIIQARMGGSRLKGKSLMHIGGIPLLDRVIMMAKLLPFVDEVAVATTVLPEDKPIKLVAEYLGVIVFMGSVTNLLERYYKSSIDMKECDTIIRMTADNPLSCPDISAEVLKIHKKNDNDYTYIDGLSHIVPEFIKVKALRKMYNSSNIDDFDKEHITPFFRKHKDLFKVQTLEAGFCGLRHDLEKYITVDTIDDLYRIEQIIKEFNIDNGHITDLKKIYAWLEKSLLQKNQKGNNNTISLNGTRIGKDYPVYVIAEIGQNHNGDIKIARQLIDMAVRCRANAVKFQKRDISCELTKEAFLMPYDNFNSFGRTYGEHRIFLEFNEQQHMELKEYALAVGITYFCTPCDSPSVELLERIGCPFYKVASRDLTNIPLLEKLGALNKPVIISTGMADFEDIDNALNALKATPDKVIVMHCTSEYPCKLENVNLKAIETLYKKYGYIVGFSDHTSGIITSAVAPIFGAAIIEKHITLSRAMKGSDQAGSLEESGLKKLIDYIRAIETAQGSGEKVINPATLAAKKKLARSITSKIHIEKGTVLTEDMLILKSPGTGLKWVERNKMIGKKAKQDIADDITLTEDMFY